MGDFDEGWWKRRRGADKVDKEKEAVEGRLVRERHGSAPQQPREGGRVVEAAHTCPGRSLQGRAGGRMCLPCGAWRHLFVEENGNQAPMLVAVAAAGYSRPREPLVLLAAVRCKRLEEVGTKTLAVLALGGRVVCAHVQRVETWEATGEKNKTHPQKIGGGSTPATIGKPGLPLPLPPPRLARRGGCCQTQARQTHANTHSQRRAPGGAFTTKKESAAYRGS